MSTLFDHMLRVAKELRDKYPTRKVGKGRIVRATDAHGLSDEERAEAEQIGKERTAKQVLDVLEIDLLKTFGADGAMNISQPDLEELRWKVRQLARAIADLTKQHERYAKLLAEAEKLA